MKRYFISIAICSIFVIPSLVLADFTPGKEATDNLLMTSAYSLKKGEWQIGIGPLWYGLTDNIMLGTNLFSLLFLAIDANAKINILNEHKGAPLGLGINLGFSQFKMFDATWTTFGARATISKMIMHPSQQSNVGRTDIHLGGSFYKFSLSTKNLDTTETWTSPRGNAVSGGFDYYTSDHIRLIGDVSYILPTEVEGTKIDATLWFGGGLHIAWKNFNLKLGLSTSPDLLSSDSPLKLIPVINLYWRFGGNPPTGN